MTDIVEWLRQEAELVALDRLSEAAAGIVRLKAKNKALREEIDSLACREPKP